MLKVGMKVRLDEAGRRYPIGSILTIIKISSSGVGNAVQVQYKGNPPWWLHLPVALTPVVTKVTKTKPYNHIGENA